MLLFNLRFELIGDLLVTSHDLDPRQLSNEETSAARDSPVQELSLLVESDVVSTNQICVFVPNLVDLLSVEFVADFVDALVEEEYLVYLLKFFEK